MNIFLLAQYNQTEYGVGYALVAMFVVLGLLAICIPRPRKDRFIDKEEEKRIKAEKLKAKRDKQKAKKKKKKQKKKKAT